MVFRCASDELKGSVERGATGRIRQLAESMGAVEALSFEEVLR